LDNLSKLVFYVSFTLMILFPTIPLFSSELSIFIESGNDSWEVVDVLGRVFVFNETPLRVVSLAPSITEILFALGKQYSIIGVDAISYDDQHYNISSYVREKGIVNVGGYWWSLVDIQTIISLNPDLVIADSGAHKPLLDIFNEYGVRAFYLYGGSARNLEEVFSDIIRVGIIFNDRDRAVKLVESIQSEFLKYRDIITNQFYSVKVLFIIGLDGGIWVAGKSTFIDDVLTKLGLINAIDREGWLLLSIEDLYRIQPDAIIVASMFDISNTIKLVEEYELYSITKKVYVFKPFETDFFLRPGPLIVNVPRLIYSLLDYWNLRKPPPISEHSYLPIIVLVITLSIFVFKRIKK